MVLFNFWGGRRKQGASGAYQPAPQPPPAPVDEVVQQGVMIAEVAVRMAAKNFIIINAMGDQASYVAADVERVVRAELRQVAAEKVADASRIPEPIAKGGWWRRSKGEVEDVFGIAGDANANRRRLVYRKLSAKLDRLARDEAYVSDIAERSRQDAWDELRKSFEVMLRDPLRQRVDAQYAEKRDARIQHLLTRDLAKLARRQGRAL